MLTLEIDFLDAINGTSKTITFGRTDICITCKGNKAKPGNSPTTRG
jgi:DnaJ-class molecular chaperone